MACHYAEPGHTPLVLGALYVRALWWDAPWRWRLLAVNEATGVATLVRRGCPRHFVSASELTRWHLIDGPGPSPCPVTIILA